MSKGLDRQVVRRSPSPAQKVFLYFLPFSSVAETVMIFGNALVRGYVSLASFLPAR